MARSGAGLPVFLVEWRTGSVLASGGCWDGQDGGERGGDLARPRASAVGSRSRRCRPPRVRRAGTCSIRNRSVLGSAVARSPSQGEQPQPGGQVGGDRGDLDPDLVDRVLPGREPAQAGVLGDPDAVLDAGVGTVPGFQERRAGRRRCWWRRLGSASRRLVRTTSARRRGGAFRGAR